MAGLEREHQARGFRLPQISAGGSWYQGSDSSLQQATIQDELGNIIAFNTVDADSDFDGFGWTAVLRQTLFRLY